MVSSGYLKFSFQILKKKESKALTLLSPCRVCPRECGADRDKIFPKRLGFCRVGRKVRVFAYHPHFGEEKVLVGKGGSGTIFFSSCNLACLFCQNWEISQLRLGKEFQKEQFAQIMLDLQNQGCENINFVSPTIWVPQILEALIIARKKGLHLPLVYNSSGYDKVETLKILKGIIDIYLPDLKYSSNEKGAVYSQVSDYWQVAQEALLEMDSQVGPLKIENGIAKKGLLVRHLVLPNNIAGTEQVLEFLAKNLSPQTAINLMDQYFPQYRAGDFFELSRPITKKEYQEALKLAQKLDLRIIK